MDSPRAGMEPSRPLPSTPPGGGRLRVANVSKRYGTNTILSALDFETEPGEFFTILGPSGSGKTTLLLIIAGFLQPDSGTVSLDGAELGNVPPERREIGIVFQDLGLFPHLDVLGNVTFPLLMKGSSREEARDPALRMLDLVGLPGCARRYPASLSGGEKQRVALARALVNPPKVLLMDEPLGALDRPLREELQREIRRIRDEYHLTICYVTHDRDEAFLMSDRIAILDHSRIIQVSSPQQLYFQPHTSYVAKFLGDANFLPVKLAQRTSSGVLIELPDGNQTCIAADGIPGGLRDGTVLIRPESIRVVKGEAPSIERGLAWRGTVKEIGFLGGVCRLSISTESGLQLRASWPSTEALDAGDAVWLACAPESIHVFPENSYGRSA